MISNIPEKTIAAIEAEGVSKQNLASMLPISLGRGKPHSNLINTDLITIVRSNFQQLWGIGFPNYTAPKITGDQNAFRGFAPYVKHIQQQWIEEGIVLEPSNIITSSSGAQSLSTAFIDHYRRDGFHFATMQATYDRMKAHIQQDTKILGIPEDNAEYLIEEFFLSKAKGCLYIVNPGNNPTGSTFSRDALWHICFSASEGDGRVLMDGAYWQLQLQPDSPSFFDSEFGSFIQDGTLVIVRSATKEGGVRGAAYAIGGTEDINQVLRSQSNVRLAPNYNIQAEQLLFETCPEDYLNWLGGILTSQKFLERIILPQLNKTYSRIKEILGAKASEASYGYNLTVKLPNEDSFFKTLEKFGVSSPNLSAFLVYDYPQPGFRIPFGGFDPDEIMVAGQLIQSAYEETFGCSDCN